MGNLQKDVFILKRDAGAEDQPRKLWKAAGSQRVFEQQNSSKSTKMIEIQEIEKAGEAMG